MAGTTLTTADSALKEFYEPGARNQLNNDIPLLAQLEKNSRDIEGRRAVLSLKTSRNSGVGARAEGGTLPTAGAQGYSEERVPLRYNYGRIQLTGPVIRAMKSDRGSFVRAVKSEMDGVTDDLKRDVSRQAWGNADGKWATCGTTTTSTTVQLAAATSAVQMRLFQIGDKIDIGTVAAPTTIVAAAVVSAVDVANKTITIDSSVSTTAAHFVFRAGANSANATAEITGMQAIVKASGTLHNVAGTGVWTSYVDSAGGAFSETVAAKAVQNVQINSGKYPNLGVCSDGVHRAIAALLQTQKRFNGTIALKGGYSGIDFTAAGPTIPLVWDQFCPSGDIFWLNTDQLQEYQESDWEFMQEDGAILSRVSGVDAYEATLFKYHEVATDQRNSHGLQTGLTEA
jgi:hypothetical protein